VEQIVSNEDVHFVSDAPPTPRTAQDVVESLDTDLETNYKHRLIKVYDSASHGTFKYVQSSCGHKFVPGKEPRHRGCQVCWFGYFTTYGELTQTADEVYVKYGETALVQLRGRTFTTNFLKYMGVIAQWKALSEQAAQEATEVVANDDPDIEDAV
jgi:hypothetical protein